jgi:hypothetical protein
VDGVREEFRLLKPSGDPAAIIPIAMTCYSPASWGFFICGCADDKVVIGYIATTLETTVGKMLSLFLWTTAERRGGKGEDSKRASLCLSFPSNQLKL